MDDYIKALMLLLEECASDDDYTRLDGSQGTTVRAGAMRDAARLLARLEAVERKASYAESHLERAQEYYRHGPTIGGIHARAKDGMLYALPIIDTHVVNGAIMVTVAMQEKP